MKRIGFVSVVAVILVGCQSERVLPPPTAMIQDAQHNGGNAFFFWTPPLVNQQPPATQVFSSKLSPIITVTDLCNNGAVIRTFSGADISVSNARYHANWHTDQDNLLATCTYRINVQVGGTLLGFADVDVVTSGRELKNVNTNQYIPLLDDRTLPIQFFIGVGSLCRSAASDCGEGTAHADQDNVFVTTNGQAGVFIPKGAVSSDVTISIESSDDRPCFSGLLDPVFPGTPGAVGNACYDYRTDPPLSEVNEGGKFNKPVTVGICPGANAFALDHATLDLLQIFQFDVISERGVIQALNNVPAPFLRCDPNFNPSLGARHSRVLDLAARRLRSLLAPVAALVTPQPLYARSARMMFDLGAGGSTDGFSRFEWALPAIQLINFDQAPDLSAVAPGTVVNNLYTRLGVTFSRTNPEGLCPGTAVYANDHGPGEFNSGQNNVTVCPEGVASDFSELDFGAIEATFTLPGVEACVDATPIGLPGGLPGAQAYIEAFDASGEVIDRTESTTESVVQHLCVSGEAIAGVRFAGKGAGFAIFDNFSYVRALPQE